MSSYESATIWGVSCPYEPVVHTSDTNHGSHLWPVVERQLLPMMGNGKKRTHGLRGHVWLLPSSLCLTPAHTALLCFQKPHPLLCHRHLFCTSLGLHLPQLRGHHFQWPQRSPFPVASLIARSRVCHFQTRQSLPSSECY